MKWMIDRSVLLGVTGGISAYRATDIIRGIINDGSSVNVVMTRAAQEFITPLTLQTLSHNPVITDLFDLISESRIGHISLADRADLLLVAPATANIIGKFANGIADDMLSTIYLATTAPVILAPAMNEKMFLNPAVQENMEKLKERGVTFVDPGRGELACGDIGYGRLAPVDEILEKARNALAPKLLNGKRVIVTAGPTKEPIDPVRDITNRSSGKMGYALARMARMLGAQVSLVSGPTSLNDPSGVKTVRVRTGKEMHKAVMDELSGADLVVKTAAVADFRPKGVKGEKIKKGDFDGKILMEKNIDILETLGKKNRRPYLVGFAAETEKMRDNALKKIESKKIDAIVANDVSRDDIGFSSDFNQVTIYFSDGEETHIPRKEKEGVAFDILREIAKRLSG